ncbi:MAG: hypothetical protein JRD89_00515 [Deltaproteobacteria bacterium]|nr:hypothetical protein [Deltaproteobacteria bacterium]
MWRRLVKWIRDSASEIAWVGYLIPLDPTGESGPIGFRGALHFWKIYGDYPDWLWRILWRGEARRYDPVRWKKADPRGYWQWIHGEEAK